MVSSDGNLSERSVEVFQELGMGALVLEIGVEEIPGGNQEVGLLGPDQFNHPTNLSCGRPMTEMEVRDLHDAERLAFGSLW